MEQDLARTPDPPISNELGDIATQAPGTRTVPDATLLLVIEKHKRFYLHTLRVGSADSAPAVMERVRAKREQFASHAYLLKPLRHFFWEHTIETATICTFRSDVESQPAVSEVIVRTREPCFELTFGYKRPGLLNSTQPFISRYPDVLANNSSSKVLLVGWRLNESAVLWLSLASFLAAVIAGILVGVSAHNIAIGIQTTAEIIGAIGIIVSLFI